MNGNNLIGKLNKLPFFKGQSAEQFKRYLLVGISSFLIEITLFVILNFVIKDIVICNSIVYSVCFIFNFLLNRNWTFKSKADAKRQLFLYLILFIFNLFISNYIVKYSLIALNSVNTVWSSVNKVISKTFSAGVIVIWNFIVYKKVIYVNKKNKDDEEVHNG